MILGPVNLVARVALTSKKVSKIVCSAHCVILQTFLTSKFIFKVGVGG